jgi:ubiquitin-conjugating enzyme E2 M
MTLKISPEMGYWKGASFDFTISVPAEYPIKPPKVLCKTKIYHPNIDLEGHVCLNILRDDWRPSLTINHIVLGMLTLFYEPNDKDPLNKDAAEVMRTNEAEFRRNVQTSLSGGKVKGESFPKLI